MAKNRKTILVRIIIMLFVIILGGTVFFNLPPIRLQRALSLGYKYLEELEYQEAIVAFQEAIDIEERCLEAYKGALVAYQELGQEDEILDFYEEAVDVLDYYAGELSEEKLHIAVFIYKEAKDIYKDDTESYIQVLEQAYVVTEKDEDIREELEEAYLATEEIDKKGEIPTKIPEWVDKEIICEIFDIDEEEVVQRDVEEEGEEDQETEGEEEQVYIPKKSVTYLYYLYDGGETTPKSTTVKEYNEYGRVLEETTHQINDTQFGFRYKYDENGKLLESEYYHGEYEGEVVERVFYDENENEIQRIGYYNAENALVGTRNYENEYDEHGNLVKKTSELDGTITNISEFEYDENGNQIRHTSDDVIFRDDDYYISTYEYDEQGKLIEEIIYFDAKVFTYKYEYDEHGNVIKEEKYDSEGELYERSITEYEYILSPKQN